MTNRILNAIENHARISTEDLAAIICSTPAEVEKELFTPEEIEASKLRVALISEMIKARQEQGLTQRDLEKLSGVAQPVIARIENGKFPALNSVYRPLQEADARVCNGFYE